MHILLLRARDCRDLLLARPDGQCAKSCWQDWYAYETVLALELTKGEVDYLVATPKFIRIIPALPRSGTRSPVVIRIQAPVFKKSEPNNPIVGLIVIGKARQAPTGIPKPNPSSALELHGKRIRGLNYEVWHDNPDGSVVKGWHEHLWSPEDQDAYVVLARPKPARKGLLDIFKWSLQKWNIEVLAKQAEVPGWEE